jgi:hypothetical protein
VRATEGLRARVEALTVRVDEASVHIGPVALPSYPGGLRPHSTVTLAGAGERGCGEHVGWSDEVHAAFASRPIPSGTSTIGEWSARLRARPPYERAALEAAAIDLALRQHRTSLFELAGVAPAPVRYVVSFARAADPVAEARHVAAGELEVKVDADPGWDEFTWRRLASLLQVAVVDFKMVGRIADHERAHAHVPDAWIEDPKPGRGPWSPSLLARLSADADVTSVAALDALIPRPAAVNVKPARMGGVLESISCLVRCRAEGIATYVGGMFEVGVGRAQLLTLASIFCPDGPNDIAPLLVTGSRPPRLVARAGFGLAEIATS